MAVSRVNYDDGAVEIITLNYVKVETIAWPTSSSS